MKVSDPEMVGKPKNHYVPGYDKVKHHEWRTAENSAAYLIPVLKDKAAGNPRITLLDIGAGSGTITASLAKYMPDGQVTATDISDDILKKAADHAKSVDATNISFQPANVYELPFPDGAFDIVHVHQVLCHLEVPVKALKEMLRVTKRGGVVAVRECDLRMWSIWPDLPAISVWHQKVLLGTHEDNKGSINAGPQLVSWAMQAGARREQIKTSCGTWTYSTRAEREVWGGTMADRTSNGDTGKKALAAGLVTEGDLEEMAKAWQQWVDAEDGWFGCLHGEVLIFR